VFWTGIVTIEEPPQQVLQAAVERLYEGSDVVAAYNGNVCDATGTRVVEAPPAQVLHGTVERLTAGSD